MGWSQEGRLPGGKDVRDERKPAADPGHGEGEEQHECDCLEQLDDAGVHRPTDRQAGQHQHDEDPAV
jgi:hypothetical protein